MIVRSKTQFFDLWKAGVLGNRTRLWSDPKEALDWAIKEHDLGREREIGFREIGKSGGGAWEKTHWTNILIVAESWRMLGRKFIMDDGAPDDKRTLCGEICRTYRGLEGTLGVVQMPMREAMKQGLLIPRTGATVLALLDKYMDDSSQEDLRAILDLFPDATVELSCFTVDVGVFPNRNTLFWEVRNY